MNARCNLYFESYKMLCVASLSQDLSQWAFFALSWIALFINSIWKREDNQLW